MLSVNRPVSCCREQFTVFWRLGRREAARRFSRARDRRWDQERVRKPFPMPGDRTGRAVRDAVGTPGQGQGGCPMRQGEAEMRGAAGGAERSDRSASRLAEPGGRGSRAAHFSASALRTSGRRCAPPLAGMRGAEGKSVAFRVSSDTFRRCQICLISWGSLPVSEGKELLISICFRPCKCKDSAGNLSCVLNYLKTININQSNGVELAFRPSDHSLMHIHNVSTCSSLFLKTRLCLTTLSPFQPLMACNEIASNFTLRQCLPNLWF